jgi:acetyltransferase-like isoleucine patch superfamily enzyme
VIRWLRMRLLFVLIALLRRRQHSSEWLRQIFKRHFAIEVGYYSYGCFDPWRMPGPMTVGRYCSIASSVRSALRNHPVDSLTTHPVLYERKFGLVDADPGAAPILVIEDDVWIGHNATILPGCKHIGRGAIIGAGAIVTRDVEPYAVVAGNPARILYRRFTPEMIDAIEANRWWENDLEGLRAIRKMYPDLLFKPDPEQLRTLPDG